MNPIEEKAIETVELFQVMTHTDLELYLIGEYQHTPKNKILEAISSVSEDGKVKRIEYRLPGLPLQSRYLYMPAGTRLI